MTTEMEPAPLDLTAYTRPEQLERLGPQRLQSALKWLGYGGADMPKNGVQLARRLFATRGVPPERLTADFFDNWVDEYKYTEPQFLDLRNITSVTQLEELGSLRLKAASKAVGIKCAGTLQSMAQRLFATRGIPREKWPADFFPTKHGQRSTVKKRMEAKLFPSYMKRPDANQKIIMPKPSPKGGKASSNTGWKRNNSRSSNLNLPPPPPPPLPSSPPPPPPPPPRSSGATQGGQSSWSQSSSYGSTQSSSLPAYTTTTASTAASVAPSWPGQNYPPPSEQLYNYHAFPPSTYLPVSVAGFTYGYGTTGAASGYTSTGTYIQPSATASASSSTSLYTTLAGTTTTPSYSAQSSVSGSTYTSGASTGTYAYTPAVQSGAGYTSQSASTGSAGSYGYGTQSATSSNQPTTSSYDTGGSSYDTGNGSYDTGDTGYGTGDTGYGTGDTRYDNDDTSYNTGDNSYDTRYNTDDNRYNADDSSYNTGTDRNWRDSSKSAEYTTKDWKTTSNVDDTGTPNSWSTSYGNWDRPDDRSTAGTSDANMGKQSRWSSAESAKGVTVGKGTTGSKFRMMQCKDCNIFLSTDEQYKEHMVSEQHILKVGGDLSEVRAARNAQQQVDRQRFHPYSRPGERQHNQQTELSQKTINEIEEEKWRMYAMRYEVKLTDSRDPGGLGGGRFGKIGKRRGGQKARERRDQLKTRRMKEQSGKVTKSDDEDDIYRRLPSQMEHRGLGYVEHSRFEAPKDIKLDTFVKKGQLHMDTGMRLNKYIKKKQQEEMGAPALPESGVPQFGAAPPPPEYEMPRQSLRPRNIGLKDKNEPMKISFDTPEDIMRAAIVIPLLVPHLEIPGMDKIKQALFLSANPGMVNQDAAFQNQDMLAAAKDVVSTLKEGNPDQEGDENQEQEMEVTEGDIGAEATSKEKETQPKLKSLLDLDLSQGNTLFAGSHTGQDSQMAASANQAQTNDAENPAKNKLLSNLSSVYDKPDVLQNPAVLNFLAQAQPAAIAKVKPTKPILKKLPPAVIDEIIYEAQMIAEQMDRQMQEALDITLAQLYGGPGLLGPAPHKRRRFDDWDDGYFGDDDYDDYGDPYGDEYNDDQYARRFGFGDYRDERRMEEDAFRRNFNRRRREFDHRRGIDFDGPWDFDGPRDDFYDPREFYGRRLYDDSWGESDEYSNYRKKRKGNKPPADDALPEPDAESTQDDYMERKIKERQMQQQRQANKKKRRKESKSKDKEEEEDDADDADSTPSHPIRSALPPQLLGLTEADVEGNQDDNQDDGNQDDYMERKAKERQKQKQGNKKHQKESKSKDKEEKDDVDDADVTPSHPMRSALPAQLLAALSDSSSPAEKDQSETVQNTSNKDSDESNKSQQVKDAEKKQSRKSKRKSEQKNSNDEKMDESSEPTRPLRSAIPAQLLNEMNKQPESSKKRGAKEDAGTKDDSKPSHPIRSALPAQLLSEGGSGPGGKKSKTASKDGSQKTQQSQSVDSVENMEVHKQAGEPESKKIKSPETNKEALKSFKIPKKQTPAPKKGISGSHPVRSAIPPQLLGDIQKSTPSGGAQSHSKDSEQVQQPLQKPNEGNQTKSQGQSKKASPKPSKQGESDKKKPKGQESQDSTDKSKDEGQTRSVRSALPPQLVTETNQARNAQKKPTSTPSETNTKKTHPIRSALPAQLLAGIDKEGATEDDEETSPSTSKIDAKTEKAKKIGLPTEDYGQKKGGGPMKRRGRKSPRTEKIGDLYGL